MGFYQERIFPILLDGVMNNHVMDRQRAKVVSRAAGTVLEVGAGSGLNIPFYDTRGIETLVALEPDPALRQRFRSRVSGEAIDVQVLAGVAEALPLKSNSVDAVVLTYTLCSVASPRVAISEVYRVLKPGGYLLFSEHGLAPDPMTRGLQRAANCVWTPIACGCHLDRDVEALVRSAPFESCDVHSAYLPGPRFVSFTTWGSARKGGSSS